MTVNVPLVRVKLLRAINGNPDSYSYSYSCLCERSLRLGRVLPNHGALNDKLKLLPSAEKVLLHGFQYETNTKQYSLIIFVLH